MSVKELEATKLLPFHVPHKAGRQEAYVTRALAAGKFGPGGWFSGEAERWLVDRTGCRRAVLTGSCTAGLEIAALALGVGPGDEVIVPTFTFCATATAFERTGARIVFCDIDPATMMMDVADVERRITSRTKVILVVHYGGAAADLSRLGAIAERRGIHLVEDAAQGFGSTWNGRALGSFGTFGAFSFHETKVVGCGQGGALLVNTDDPVLLDRVDEIIERGTDFSRVKSGAKAFYEWTSPGSSFRLGELQAALLLAQFEEFDEMLALRRRLGDAVLQALDVRRLPLRLLRTDAHTAGNHHFIGAVADSERIADALMRHLGQCGIDARAHYVPLHLSPRARQMGYAVSLPNAEGVWKRLVRLPVHTAMTEGDADRCVRSVNDVRAWSREGASDPGPSFATAKRPARRYSAAARRPSRSAA